MKNPQLIEGGNHTDERGQISYVNDFCFDKIVRFYVIENSETHDTRAWQGHKLDEKNFFCVHGSFEVSCVKIDDWENPSKDLEVKRFILRASESGVLHIPSGYANSIRSLEPESKLISFSTLPLNKVSEDDVRYDKNMWKS